MSLSLDGYVINTVSNTSGTSVSATLTTSQSNDIIVAVVHWFAAYNSTQTGTGGPPLVSNISGAGLNWALRSHTVVGAPSFSGWQHFVSVFWAVAPSALSSQTITATVLNPGLAFGEMLCFGVNGADLLLPWDTNASLPAVITSGTSSHTVSGISSNNSNVMELCFLAHCHGGSATVTADSGFTKIAQAYDDVNYSAFFGEYQILGSALSGASQNVWANVSTVSTDYIAVVDAIKAAPTTSWTGPTYVNSGALSVTAATSQTPALPSSRVNGNLLLATCSITSSLASPTWSAGWNVVETWTIGSQTGTKAWRYVTGSETAPTISWTSGSTGTMAQVHQFTGVSQSSPIGASSHNSATSNSISTSAITTTASNSLIFNFTDFGQLYTATPPPKYMGATVGVGNVGAYGAGVASWELAPSSGTVSDSVTTPSYAGNTIDWLDFLTEILAAGSVGTGSGAADGSASVSGAGARLATAVGNADGSSSVAGTGLLVRTSAGVANGSASVAGVGAYAVPSYGSAAGSASVAGVGASIATAVGQSDGAASVSGAGVGGTKGDGVGQSDGAATVSGVGRSLFQAVGTANGSASVSGAAAALGKAAGFVDGSSTVACVTLAAKTAAGAADGQASALGHSFASAPFYAHADGKASVIGVSLVAGGAIGTANGVASVQGVGKSLAAATGNAAGSASAQGLAAFNAKAIGNADGVASVSGVSQAIKASPGYADGQADVRAVGSSIPRGNADGSSDVSGVSHALSASAGQADGQASVLGVPSLTSSGAGEADGTSSVNGDSSHHQAAAGEADGSSDVEGISATLSEATGEADGSSDVEGSAKPFGQPGIAKVTWTLAGSTAVAWTEPLELAA